MTGAEAIAYIESISWRGSRPGLSRTRELLRRMGNPEKDLRFIHIAGTNGKGSAAAMLESVLRCCGFRTGLFISPFLERFNERIQIAGEEIPDEDLGEITAMVRPLAESMDDPPTEFELITAVGFEYFRRRGCDLVVLEVGMGGRLDSTNVIPAPLVAVIMNIGLDHTKELGATAPLIAAEKAGILKPGCRAVLYEQGEDVMDVVRQRCRELDIPLSIPAFGEIRVLRDEIGGQTFDYRDYTGVELHLPGPHQRKNAAVVLTVLDNLAALGYHIPRTAVYEGLRRTVWPGRFEVLHTAPFFIADGGHNLQCVRAVCDALDDYFPGRKVLMILGILADKDYRAMCALLGPRAGFLFPVTPDSPRALPAEELVRVPELAGIPAALCGSVPAAVDAAFERAKKDDIILSVGSLYMTGAIRRSVLTRFPNK